MSVDKARLANDFSKMQSQSKHNKKNVDSLKKTVRRLQLKVSYYFPVKLSKIIHCVYTHVLINLYLLVLILVEKTWSSNVPAKCSTS